MEVLAPLLEVAVAARFLFQQVGMFVRFGDPHVFGVDAEFFSPECYSFVHVHEYTPDRKSTPSTRLLSSHRVLGV